MNIEIPADVRDNSETVTDYAFMGHLAPGKGVVSPLDRETDVNNAAFFGYKVYTWRDINPDGQRCAFTLIATWGGAVRHLFHTEYFTRVPCITHDTHYARAYASITDYDGVTTIASPYCDECLSSLRRSAKAADMVFNESERLLTGQH